MVCSENMVSKSLTASFLKIPFEKLLSIRYQKNCSITGFMDHITIATTKNAELMDLTTVMAVKFRKK